MNIAKTSFAFFRLLLILLAATQLSACEKSRDADPHAAAPEPMPKCREAKAGGPEEVVRTLYKQYSFEADKRIDNESEEVIAKFFDKKLTKLMLRIRECEGNCISYDYLYNANALQMTDFQVCAMDAHKNTVKVQFRNSGHPTIITYKLTNTDVGWRISDSLLSNQGESWTLSEMLSGI